LEEKNEKLISEGAENAEINMTDIGSRKSILYLCSKFKILFKQTAKSQRAKEPKNK
jgi:hypothetical protein